MAVSSVSSSNTPPPAPQTGNREAARNDREVRSDQDSGDRTKAQKLPPPSTSPQGEMVGSVVDTKA